MPQFLPPSLLALFNARDPIPYLPPVDQLSWEKKTDGYSGVGHLISRFENPKETPPIVAVETKDERVARRKREKAEQVQYKLEQEIALWDPQANPDADSDPYKTLYVARLNYDTSESKLRREFEGYGPIKQIKLVHNKNTGKPRGYAFIEYEHERDMHSAYKHADGKKIDNRRILVDVERARTVAGWLPRRLGGGLGGTRLGGEDVNVRISGRENDRKRTDERIMREERERDGDRRRDRDRDYDRRDRDRGRRDDRDRRRRSRSRDRKRKRSPSPEVARRRHRSRERNGEDDERRHRGDRNGQEDEERKRKDHRRRSRDRSRERRKREKERARDPENSIKIKQEPQDDYPDFAQPPLLSDANFPLKPEQE